MVETYHITDSRPDGGRAMLAMDRPVAYGQEQGLRRLTAQRIRELIAQGPPDLETLARMVHRELPPDPSVELVATTIVASAAAIEVTTLEPARQHGSDLVLPTSAEEALLVTGELGQYLWDIMPVVMSRLERRAVDTSSDDAFTGARHYAKTALLFRPDHANQRDSAGVRVTIDYGADESRQTPRRMTVRATLGEPRDDLTMVLSAAHLTGVSNDDGSPEAVFYLSQARGADYADVRQEASDLESDLLKIAMIRIIAENMIGYLPEHDNEARQHVAGARPPRELRTVREVLGARADEGIVMIDGRPVDPGSSVGSGLMQQVVTGADGRLMTYHGWRNWPL